MAHKSILIIEDDEEMIALGELILQKQGYKVFSATNGAAGLELLASEPIDLVLLDIMMEEMDGWDVLEQIRANRQTAQVPVIMLSARHYLEDEQETARHVHQYHSYIVKPFIVGDLIDEVGKILSAQG